MTAPGQGLTCPSAPAEPGALLLGLKGPQGRIVPLRSAMTVDEGFISAATAEGPPEARMRFASPCREGGCAQWTGDRCGVIARVMDHLKVSHDPAPGLPPCLIRATCRWHAERGSAACKVCDLVVTDQVAAG
ncbi:MAG: hypothetical protein KF887_09140 [Paracoccaceae bacterium]|nr:MAG: hypothetical protein KF887_09140 [Paracoccaceae bacterium]